MATRHILRNKLFFLYCFKYSVGISKLVAPRPPGHCSFLRRKNTLGEKNRQQKKLIL